MDFFTLAILRHLAWDVLHCLIFLSFFLFQLNLNLHIFSFFDPTWFTSSNSEIEIRRGIPLDVVYCCALDTPLVFFFSFSFPLLVII